MCKGLTWNRLLLLPLFWQLAACGPDLPKDVEQAYRELPEKIDYNLHVKPILSDKCFSCHGPDKANQKAGLRLDIDSAAYGELPESPGKYAIDPGNPEGSELFHRILSDDPEYQMPSKDSHLSLSAKEKAILVKWISEGAQYKPHWAFVAPEKPELPEVQHNDWVINPVDNFILHRMEQEGLAPSKAAEKAHLLRRLSLDLTGLPPTIEELDAFLKDASADAYAKQVERLLQSPHFGEKMAVDWLDLARYADSHGYTVDALRDMSPYRDWVIKAINDNMPYDKFIQWQLAGDLMPKPTKEMRIATAFNRLHQQNLEGGIIEEEFKAEYVVDRVNTTGEAMMGLTVGCARCHDHKFDPISQKNYYELFSFFNNVKEAGQISWDGAMPTPTMMLPDEEKSKIMAFFQDSITRQEQAVQATAQQGEAGFDHWMQAKPDLPAGSIPKKGLQAQFTFDQGNLHNLAQPALSGSMRRGLDNAPGEPPVFVTGASGKALALGGDEWLDCKPVGVFRKSDPFSIAISLYVPKEFKEGVIFHKCVAERLMNYRGYHLYCRNNKFELALSHTAPSNAITRISVQEIPREKWFKLVMTYDGSGRAGGLNLYIDGQPWALETTMDQLYKDILLNGDNQPGLQVGGWDRGLGFKGGRVDDLLVYNRTLTALEIRQMAGLPLSGDRKDWKQYYLSVVDPAYQEGLRQLQRLRARLADSTENIPEIMVMQEMPKPRQSYILQRGNYDAIGDKVYPNTPSAILPFPSNLPKNRLGLAQWLVDPKHPLTARVAVNRYWQNFFGTGLVKTAEDFGNQGELPSHPELLDWLAVSFRESGWDVKKLCRMIVLSATYRQEATASAIAREKDPENRLLSHGPAVRLSAEMLRDNVLTASGLLNPAIGGKSVKPYQPPGLWEINNTSYQADSGAAVHRRSLYVLVKRSVPNPTLATFDAPSRSYCVVRRQATNTPLQALVTLNDPTYVEAAKVLGVQMTQSGDLRQGIVQAYRKLTGLEPDAATLKLLQELQEKEWQKFRANQAKTKGWLGAGQYRVAANLDPAQVAANAVVASVIMNSDATLTKR